MQKLVFLWAYRKGTVILVAVGLLLAVVGLGYFGYRSFTNTRSTENLVAQLQAGNECLAGLACEDLSSVNIRLVLQPWGKLSFWEFSSRKVEDSARGDCLIERFEKARLDPAPVGGWVSAVIPLVALAPNCSGTEYRIRMNW